MDYQSQFARFRCITALAAMMTVLATVFTPALSASQAPPTDTPTFSTRSMARVVAAGSSDALRPNRAKTPSGKTAPKQAAKSGSFFKSRTGLFVIAVMAVGTGYAVYSAKNDRIRGSVR